MNAREFVNYELEFDLNSPYVHVEVELEVHTMN